MYKNSLFLWHQTGRKIKCILTGGLICTGSSWLCQATFDVGRQYLSTYSMEKWTKPTYAVFRACTCHRPGKPPGVMCLKELEEHEVEMSQTLLCALGEKSKQGGDGLRCIWNIENLLQWMRMAMRRDETWCTGRHKMVVQNLESEVKSRNLWIPW